MKAQIMKDKEVRKWIYSKKLDKELLRLAIIKTKIDNMKLNETAYVVDDVLEMIKLSNTLGLVKVALIGITNTQNLGDSEFLEEVRNYIFDLKIPSEYYVIARLMVENGEEIEDE